MGAGGQQGLTGGSRETARSPKRRSPKSPAVAPSHEVGIEARIGSVCLSVRHRSALCLFRHGVAPTARRPGAARVTFTRAAHTPAAGLSVLYRNLAESVRAWPTLTLCGALRPTWANSGQTLPRLGRLWPNLTEFGSKLTNFSRSSPHYTRCWPTSIEFGRHRPNSVSLGRNIGHFWPNLAHIWPCLVKCGPHLAKLAQIR